ncbi:MAG: hypothetical protein L0215_17195 [Gemmataceae bacterium]|nr:hypothetical protein [Gemmataceae bacterium]
MLKSLAVGLVSHEPDLNMETASADAVPRAERLLQAMHTVFSHDLPNQLVVIQSLAVLLDQEEKSKLSSDGVDHLTRLVGATRKASRMVQFLKRMARLEKWQEPVMTIPLAQMASAVRAETQKLFPDRTLTFDFAWHAAEARGCPAALEQALVEIVRCRLEWTRVQAARITLQSARMNNATQLQVAIASAQVAPTPGPPSRQALADSLELKLARELLATWGARLQVSEQGQDPWSGTVIFPA